MCLHLIYLNLKYDESEKDFIGYGYKAIPSCKIRDASGNINWDKAKDFMYSMEWVEATGDFSNPNANLERVIESSYRNLYFPGFHIFLRKQYANRYGLWTYENPLVVKVAFKNVTAFGSNFVGGCDTGPCVVARYMKIVEILEG